MLRALALLALTSAGLVAGLYWLGAAGTGQIPDSPPTATETPLGPSHAAESQTSTRPIPEDEQTPPVIETVRRDIRDVTPEGVVDLPRAQGETIERLPAVLPPPPPPKPPEPVSWPNPRIDTPGELVSGETTIRLAGIKPLRVDESCETAGGSWPCGRFARTALRRLVRGRTISCDPVKTSSSHIVTRCRSGGHDLSQWLVEQGWARASGEGLFAKESETARKAERGIWGKGRPR